MTAGPAPRAPAPQEPQGTGGPSPGLGAAVLLAISAAVVFWAGLSLGGQTAGRNDSERIAIEAFTEAYQRISDDFVGDSDPAALLEAAICGMFDTLGDRYSICMGPDEYQARFESIRGEFGGIGAVMQIEDAGGDPCAPIGEGCDLVVVEVLDGTPASEAGLLAEDRVTSVDGAPLEGLSLDDTVQLIRGPEGTDVTLTLERRGSAQQLRITRDRIVEEDVRAALLADGRVGYLRVDEFSPNAAGDFETALRDQLEAGAEAVLVDVRGDPGGFVDAAVDITSQFLGEGPVFWEEDADGVQVSVEVEGGGLATERDLPVAILVDGGSASASELMAGALQDAGRAMLVGEPTFGKGTIQEWTELPGDSGGFRLSVAKWLTRDKRWIEGDGLEPDAFVPAAGTMYRPGTGTDPQADAQVAHAIALLLGTSAPTPPVAVEIPVEVDMHPGPSPAG